MGNLTMPGKVKITASRGGSLSAAPLILIATSALLLCFSLVRPGNASAAVRPSFVLIQLDDLSNAHFDGRWVDRNGLVRRTMPQTRDLMLSQGLRFTSYQTPAPFCAPSRASLLSGNYAPNHEVRMNTSAWPAFRRSEIYRENLATWLQAGGYRTMQFGKFMNRYGEPDGYPTEVVPPGWDVWQADATDDSTREYYGYWLNLDGTVNGPFGAPDYGPDTVKDPAGCPDLGLASCNYHSDAITTRAVEAIGTTPPDQPFLAHLGFHTPHGDSRPPAGPEPAVRHYGSAARTPRQTPPAFDERDVSDKPPWIRSLPRVREDQLLTIRYRKSVEALRSVDESVARVFEALEQSGRLESTYVFFFSDNGFFLGEHRIIRGKGYPYQPAVQVPMVVRGPGVPRGRRSSELVANQDLAPTILSLAGLRPGRPVDGRSMTRFWKRPGIRSRRPILLQGFSSLSQGTLPPGTGPFYGGIRVGPYKYVRFRNGSRELYDLIRDPAELKNRIRDRRYREVGSYMAGLLAEYRDCRAAECRVPAPRWPGVATSRPDR